MGYLARTKATMRRGKGGKGRKPPPIMMRAMGEDPEMGGRVYRAHRTLRRGLGDVDTDISSITSQIPNGVFRPSAEAWRADLERAAPDIPTNFLVAWIDEESAGNSCDVTTLNEAGIWQTMHPQDDKYGATFDQLRAGCSGVMVVDPSAVDHDAQMAGLNMVRDYMAKADAYLAANGVRWSHDTSDYWKAVKSIHGVPCILGEALPAVAATYGPPSSWEDFQDKAMTIPASRLPSCARFLLAPSVSGNRNRLDDIFANATRAGKWGGPVLGRLPLGGGSVLVIASAALFVLMLWKRKRS